MKTPFLGSAYTSRSLNLACQEAINLYAEVVEGAQGKTIGGFFGAPGLDLEVTVGTGPIRGFDVLGNFAYVVSGNELYSLTPAKVATLLGPLPTQSGPVYMQHNSTQVLVVDGVEGQVWTPGTNTFSPDVMHGVIVNPGGIAYQDGFAISFDVGTQEFFQSDLNNLRVWGALNFSSSDAQPDNINQVFDNQREVWLFGDKGTEVWINAGLPGFSFQRLQGVFLQEGSIAPAAIALVKFKIMWLGRDKEGQGIVYRQNGYQAERASTHALENEIQSYTRIDDAIAYPYQQNGHYFYVLTFPTDGKTWMYDATESEKVGYPLWYRRAYFSQGSFSRHLSNCCTPFAGKILVGDYRNGNIYSYNLNSNYDNEDIIKRVRSWRAFDKGVGKPMRFDSLTLDCQTGIDVPPDLDPRMVLEWSDDGGHNWSNEHYARLGEAGETALPVTWRRLGQTRRMTGLDRVWRISLTEDIPVAWLGADMDASPA